MITPHQTQYLAYELTRRGPSGDVSKIAGALADAKVDLTPHQVDAALFAFQSPLSNGAILADEVGLGKTIEAGILLSQFWAEGKRKILLIMPASLRKQWSMELAEKFYLPSVILESKSYKAALKQGQRNPFDREGKDIVICSYPFAANKEEDLLSLRWDLVVMDEAHRMRNVYKPSNKTANKLRMALHGNKKILLTATPLQNSLLELYGLTTFIDEFAFGDKKAFSAQYGRLENSDRFEELKNRLKPICHRTLRHQVIEFVPYTERIPITQPFNPSDREQDLYDLVTDYLQRDELYALPNSQRHLMTIILRRLLGSSTFAIAGALNSLARKLEGVLSEDEVRRTEAEEDFEQDLDGEYDELEEELSEDESGDDEMLSTADREAIQKEIEELDRMCQLAVSINENAKGEVLLIAMEKGFDELRKNNAPEKAIIFTESRRTQDYILDLLKETEHADRIVLFNGSNTDPKSKEIYTAWKEQWQDSDRVTGTRSADMRQALVDYFRESASIMIATEAAAEGINLQFCSLVVNYDLPWNPQRIEQRIGRCHRYGQKFDVVVINFLNTKNAAEQRVFQLLNDKFKLFSGVFGASDEVLGSIESGVDFEKRITAIYRQCRTVEEINAAFRLLQDELEDRIKGRLDESHQKLLTNFNVEVVEKLRTHSKNGREFLGRVEKVLWRVTQSVLEDRAFFVPDENAFTLNTNPFGTNADIPTGRYELTKKEGHGHRYRLHHPLAQAVLREAQSYNLGSATIRFDYSGSEGKSEKLKPLVGKSGVLAARWLAVTIGSSGEDYLILGALDETGQPLSEEQSHRMMDLPGTIIGPEGPRDIEREKLNSMLEDSEAGILAGVAARCAEAFEQEMNKLEHWADDKKTALELELKELDKKIGETKREARTALALEDKVKFQREVQSMERQRAEKRRDIFEAQDRVDSKREELLSAADERLERSTARKPLFEIRWGVA